MVPLSTRKLIHRMAKDHVTLCKFLKLPDYQVHREIEIIATTICICNGVRADGRNKNFIRLIAGRYSPISDRKLIVPVPRIGV